MKLVILGAGASFDNINYYYGDNPDLSWRPPLANEIFDARENFRNIIYSFPGSAALMSELNNVTDIEEYFQNKWDFIHNHRSDEMLANLINIQYFLSFLFYKISIENRAIGNKNLDVLTRHAHEYSVAHNENIAFVSFNYDLLLEESLRKIYPIKNKIYFSNIDEYTKYPLKLFKLHGSCNWFSPLHVNVLEDNTSIEDHLYFKKISLADINKSKGNNIEVLENPGYKYNQNEKHYYFPELLIPLRDKDDFILPENHLEELKAILNKVTDIMIVGWKGSEDSFKRLLKQYMGDKKVNVLCICGNLNEASKSNIKALFPKATFQFFEESYNLQKFDNTNVDFSNSEAKKSLTHHTMGSFSAYTLNVIRKQYKNFFEI